MDEINIIKKSYIQMWLRIIATFISEFGSKTFSFGLSFYVYKETQSTISFGLTLIAIPFATVILAPIIGKIIDTYKHKHIIIISQIFSVIFVTFFLLLNNKIENILIPSLVLIIFLSIFDEFVLLTLFASNSSTIHSNHLQKLRGYQQIVSNISMIVAPVLGAILVASLSFNIFIIIEVLSEVLTLIINVFINFNLISKKDISSENSDLSMKHALSFVKEQKYLKSLILLSAIVNLSDTIYKIGLPIIVLSIFKLNNTYFGYMESSIIIGSMIGGYIMAKRKKNTQPLKSLVPLCILTSFLMIIIPLAPFINNIFIGYLLIAFTVLVIHLLESLFNIPLQVWYVEEVPEYIQGRVFAIMNALMMGSLPLGILSFGALYEVNFYSLIVLNLIAFLIAITLRISVLLYVKLILKIDLADAKVF
ncbi:MFS transporter [Macrococcoides caseolyticum]|uniref:MFS transporter n=1 Tax=Macrococcus caseolyticus (strain JCSC5402) TaxID=458233 RepID=B9EC62_MACCJ|nr:MFS transporter [Macrococcus caseolyticus]BAH18670.1 conserved hypothetical protein [Macrococcus caseolyticus JCSC5402]